MLDYPRHSSQADSATGVEILDLSPDWPNYHERLLARSTSCEQCLPGAATVVSEGLNYCVGGKVFDAGTSTYIAWRGLGQPYRTTPCPPCLKGFDIDGISVCLRDECPAGSVPFPLWGPEGRQTCLKPLDDPAKIDWRLVRGVEPPPAPSSCPEGQGVNNHRFDRCADCAAYGERLTIGNGVKVCVPQARKKKRILARKDWSSVAPKTISSGADACPAGQGLRGFLEYTCQDCRGQEIVARNGRPTCGSGAKTLNGCPAGMGVVRSILGDAPLACAPCARGVETAPDGLPACVGSGVSPKDCREGSYTNSPNSQ